MGRDGKEKGNFGARVSLLYIATRQNMLLKDKTARPKAGFCAEALKLGFGLVRLSRCETVKAGI